MAITYPYSIEYLADTLTITDVVWDIQRNDELSGTGDGRVWQSELAPPLWTANITLAPAYHEQAKPIAAKIRKLNGSQEAFYLYDPTSKYPFLDPDGTILGSSNVTVSTISAGRNAFSLSGLPAGYQLSIGDRMQIDYGTGRTAYLEVSEPVTAASNGTTPVFEVFPYIPVGIQGNASVNFKKPACKMIIFPGGHNIGSSMYRITTGASFKAIQKK